MAKISNSTWTTYRFDEMAIEIKDRVNVPRESGLDRYVGLEHLDSGSLKIWRWGSTEDVEKHKMLFKSGDIIFGRRNAYLRRVAVADFDGVCSAHSLVLRARPEVALPEFLPFFMQTETFWQAALRNSAGSLSPTINWSNIAKEEFTLPPLEEQRRIAEILNLAESSSNHLRNLALTTAKLLDTDLATTLNHGRDPLREHPLLPIGWTFTALGDLISIRHGFAFDGKCFTEEATEDPVLLTPGNFSKTGELQFLGSNTKRFNGSPPDGFWLQPGDLVVLMTDLTPTASLLGVPGIVSESTGPILQNQRIGYVANREPSRITDKFLFYSFLGQSLRRMIRSLSAGTTVHHSSPTDICSLHIPLPPIEEQGKLCRRWDAIADSRRNAELRFRELNAIQRDLLLTALNRGEQ